MATRIMVQVEVEENPNSGRLPMHVFPVVGRRRPLFQLVVASQGNVEALHWVTGWTSRKGGSPCPAYCVPVEDSGSSETVLSYLVYGGDWGLRFKPVSLSEEWSIESLQQFGEPCLLLAVDPVTEWLGRQQA